jgi:hypothetical protein
MMIERRKERVSRKVAMTRSRGARDLMANPAKAACHAAREYFSHVEVFDSPKLLLRA